MPNNNIIVCCDFNQPNIDQTNFFTIPSTWVCRQSINKFLNISAVENGRESIKSSTWSWLLTNNTGGGGGGGGTLVFWDWYHSHKRIFKIHPKSCIFQVGKQAINMLFFMFLLDLSIMFQVIFSKNEQKHTHFPQFRMFCTNFSNKKGRRALSPWKLWRALWEANVQYGPKRPLKIKDTHWCTAYQKYSNIDLISF